MTRVNTAQVPQLHWPKLPNSDSRHPLRASAECLYGAGWEQCRNASFEQWGRSTISALDNARHSLHEVPEHCVHISSRSIHRRLASLLTGHQTPPPLASAMWRDRTNLYVMPPSPGPCSSDANTPSQRHSRLIELRLSYLTLENQTRIATSPTGSRTLIIPTNDPNMPRAASRTPTRAAALRTKTGAGCSRAAHSKMMATL